MALSDCDKCWETPCKCGWEYRNSPLEIRLKLSAAILGIPEESLAALVSGEIPVIPPNGGPVNRLNS